MDTQTVPSNGAGFASEAKKSGGPQTQAGKAVSSLNALKHGLTGKFRIMREFGESQEKYSELLVALRDEHQPATVTEDFVVQRIAQSMVLIERGQLMITEFITPFEPITTERIQRYVTTHDRAFHRCLAELRKLRKDREFVSQNRQHSEFVSQNASAAVASSALAEPRTAAAPQFVSQNEQAKQFVSQKPIATPPQPVAAPSIAAQKQEILDTAKRMQAEIAETLQSIKSALRQDMEKSAA